MIGCKKMYKVKIYFEGDIITTATGEDRDYLKRWAEDVCAENKKASYTIELLQ